MKKIIICLIITMTITSTVNAAEVPRESAPCNATNEAIVIVESFIGDILTDVQNGLGYADARAKSNRIFFNAWLNGQTSGYSYGELVDIVNERKTLYASRTDENESEIKEKANEINKELQALRVDVRMCKAIAVDSYKIARKSQEVKNLLKQAEMEMKAKSKNKSRRL